MMCCLATATDKAALQKAVSLLGELQPGSIAYDRQDLDYIRVFVSKRTVVGRAIGDLDLPADVACSIVQVRRGDSDMLPRPDLILEVGDRIGVFVHRSRIKAVRNYFGDSIKGTADFSYISMGIGAALGLLVGMVPLPSARGGQVYSGSCRPASFRPVPRKDQANGARCLDHAPVGQPRTEKLRADHLPGPGRHGLGPQVLSPPLSATGPVILLYSVVITLALALITTFICLTVFRLPFDTAMGVMSGATGNPAILAFASRTTPTDRPDIGYAMIFPSMTVLKILFVQIAAVLLGA